MTGKIGLYLVLALFCTNVTSLPSSNSLGRREVAPYVVSLQQAEFSSIETGVHRCGGVLISVLYVLTSANCLYDDDVGGQIQLIHPARLRAFAGMTQGSDNSRRELFRIVSNININPQYRPTQSTHENDIAMVMIREQFPFNIVTPISLPRRDVTEASTRCTLFGWKGANTLATDLPLLLSTDYAVYDQRECQNSYSSAANIFNIFPTMVCAAPVGTSSSDCIADQGNPLICNGELTGILSISNKCQASLPDVYTRVFRYSQWIRTFIPNSAPSLVNTGLIATIVISFVVQFINLRS